MKSALATEYTQNPDITKSAFVCWKYTVPGGREGREERGGRRGEGGEGREERGERRGEGGEEEVKHTSTPTHSSSHRGTSNSFLFTQGHKQLIPL